MTVKRKISRLGRNGRSSDDTNTAIVDGSISTDTDHEVVSSKEEVGLSDQRCVDTSDDGPENNPDIIPLDNGKLNKN